MGLASPAVGDEKVVAVHTTTQAKRPLAIVLGLNEIASATAVRLHNEGYAVVMAHDPVCPVIRRGLTFVDALYEGKATLGGVTALSVDSTLAARFQVRARGGILVTRLDLSELLILGDIHALIDARLHVDGVTPQLRKLARVTVGVGRGFVPGVDCDATVAVDQERISEANAKRTLLMRSPVTGRWHTPLDIGVRIYQGFPLGYVGSSIIKAPLDGVLRGIAHDDIDVPAGAELIEISTGTGARRWWGLDVQGASIAGRVMRALQSLGAEATAPSAGARLSLVHSR
jgi:hypothetical protein